ncbi:hypothetical protein Tco_0389636, partial [Tanacetum coccineum]
MKTTPHRSGLTWKPTGRIFSNVRLRWIPTGKLFNSCTGQGTSLGGEQKQRIDLCEGTSFNVKQENLRVCSELEIHDHNNEPSSSKLVLKVVPSADKTATLRQELESLFHHHITMLSQRPRPHELNVKSNLIDLMKECRNELTSGEIVSLNNIESIKEARFKVQDLASGEIVSLNLLSRTRKLGHSTMKLRSLPMIVLGLSVVVMVDICLETDIQEKDDKASKNGQNRARNGKDKVKSKPKSVKVKSQP